MSDDLAVLHGALDKGEVGERAAEVTALATQGDDLLASITRYLHDEVERSALDKAAITGWLGKAGKMCDSLVEGSSGPAWEPDDPSTAHLAQSGVRATGVVTDVSRDGWGNERVASLKMSVSVQPVGGSTFDASRALSIAVVKAPRVGDHVEVSYDPTNPNRFVYRPALDN